MKLELEKNEEEIIKRRKSEWKKEVKEQLEKWVKKEKEEQKTKMKKLRFTNTEGKQNYLDQYKMEQVKKIMKMRLNMTELKGNYKGKYQDTVCPACEKEEETTEQVIRCPEYQRLTKHTLNKMVDEKGIDDAMNDLQWLTNAAEEFERIEETRDWLLGSRKKEERAAAI